MPESFILFHLLGDFFLLSILNFIAEVLLKQRVQANLIFIAPVS